MTLISNGPRQMAAKELEWDNLELAIFAVLAVLTVIMGVLAYAVSTVPESGRLVTYLSTGRNPLLIEGIRRFAEPSTIILGASDILLYMIVGQQRLRRTVRMLLEES